ncbi:uncharacterized protein TNCV_2943881 [Trichonephila clavipes]|nr:uncharacterized protein TNCV_2943881 [Trichonephila clavipes]
MYKEDVQGLLDFHNQNIVDELIEMHEQEQDVEEPIALVLDQTKNADAARNLTDINRFEKDMKKISIDNFSIDHEKKKKVQVGEYQEAFKKFGTSELIEKTDEQQNFLNIIRRFICNVYNAGNVIYVDAARLQMFIDLYTISDLNEAFDRKKLRNSDASNVPPCKRKLFSSFCEQTIHVPLGKMLI